ncbi:MAG: hypothetical protein AAF497_15790 [Planctomycetota bacterium]
MNTNDHHTSAAHIPRPYSSDGGFTIAGLLLTMTVGAVVALLVGLLAGVVGQFFYMVLLFPIAIGGAVAGAQVAIIGRSKVRNPLVCGFAGLISGFIAVATMHYVDYIVFQRDMAEASVKYQASVQALLEMEQGPDRESFASALAQYDAETADAKSVDSFVGYINWAAQQGVELSSATGRNSGSNLGYTGTYLYWLFESLIIAGMCVAMTGSRAARPFCIHCESWMPEKEIVTLNCDAKAASRVIRAGNLERLTSMFAANKETSLSVFQCEHCQQGDVVVQPNEVSYNNGNRCKKKAGRYVFSDSVVEYLNKLFFDVEQCDEEVVSRLQSQVNALASEAAMHADSASSDASQTGNQNGLQV